MAEVKDQKDLALSHEEKTEQVKPIKNLLWEFAKPALTASFVITLIGGIALYLYLQRIGWPELLQPSLSSGTGIGMVVSFMAILFVSLMCSVCGSGYLIGLTAQSYESHSKIPKNLKWVCISLHIVWLAYLFMAMIFFDKESTKWILNSFPYFAGGFIVLAIIFSFLFLHGFDESKADESKIMLVKRVGKGLFLNIGIGCRLVLSSFSASLGAVTFTDVVKDIDVNAKTISTGDALLVIAAALPGILIGLFYLARYRHTGNQKQSLKETAGVVISMALILSFLFPKNILRPVHMISLGAASVFSPKKHTYELLKKDRRSVYEKIGFDFENNSEKNLKEKSKKKPDTREDEPVFFYAYDGYRMGEILLLCTKGPEIWGDKSVDKKLKEEKENQGSSQGKESGLDLGGCIPPEKDEVRRVDILQKKNQEFLEKTKDNKPFFSARTQTHGST